MPSVLLSLRTDLKSLKYGHDRRGGGDSTQPYITTPIPLGSLSTATSDDGFIRGGIILADKSSLIDAQRINSFLNDKPKGRLFLERQVGLQLSNPKIETRKFAAGQGTIFSSILGIGSQALNRINDILPGPTRIYTSLNTIAQIQENAFGIHYERHGLFPIQDENTKYYNVVANNSINGFNRLLGLREKLIKPIVVRPDPVGSFNIVNAINNVLAIVGVFTNKPIKPLFTNVNLGPQELVIDEYGGGPGSSYGRGVTLIKRYDVTSNSFNITAFATEEDRKAGRVNYYNTLRISPAYKGVNNGDLNEQTPYNKGAVDKNVIAYKSNKPSLVVNGIGSPTSRTYDELKRQIDKNNSTSGSVFNFNPLKNTTLGAQSGFAALGDSYNGDIISYTTKNIEYKNGLTKNGRPVVINLNKNWRDANREQRVGSGRQDSINLTPIFEAPAGTIGDTPPINIPGANVQTINDLVKFRIQALNSENPTGNANWMIFRAYLTQFSDSTNAAWSDVKYVGRGESFYIYTGFSRKIQIGFKVAALSTEEMQPIYQKLNYLMGNLMPDYTEQGIMRGPLVKMTVGNWIDGQDGIINDLTYTIPNDSPWEIGLPVNGRNESLILPHIVEVSMTFTPIGSQTKKKNEISSKSQKISHIAQNINDLQYIK
jgi:hypothetical protein